MITKGNIPSTWRSSGAVSNKHITNINHFWQSSALLICVLSECLAQGMRGGDGEEGV